MTDITHVLAQREERYGAFPCHAKISQDLKAVMRRTPGWERLNDTQREALEMIQHKVARVLNGDPNYDDNWIDIAGYSKLAADELAEK